MQANYVDTDRTSAVRLADLSRTEISAGADTRVRGELGQFMTPAPVATFMAGLFSALPRDVRLLDAGAGVGMLTAAFVERACSVKDRPATISVTAFEVDERLAKHLKVTLEACGRHCKDANIEFNYRIIIDDYILYSAEPLMSKEAQDFNLAILNPPYAKINSKSKARAALSKMGIETSNLYTAFLALSIMQVCNGGQIVAITPRSFCNGLYFAPFRRLLLSRSALERVHLYESRKKTFEGDDVLQENIIFKLVIGEKQPEMVTLSSSLGPEDERPTTRSVPIGQIVQSGDPHFYIHLPVSVEDGDLAERVRTLPCTLRELGISVSTGRVVDFRARDHLRKEPESGAVPLIYPAHFEHGYVAWPRPNGRKPNALAFNMETTDLVVPRGTYVLTKRFTSKEEKRRLVAVVYDPARIDAEHVGFENHLNYFHVAGKGLRPDFARGLAVFLNSSAVDQYFRQFSGHTQVNATDLRKLHYPTREQLAELGRLYGSVLSPQKAIDEAVEALIS